MINHDLKVESSIIINSSVEKIWDTLTNPSKIKEYLFGTETITDWKVGSDIIFQGEYQGHKYKDKGIVIENKKNELLSYSYWSGFSGLADQPENYAKIIYTLKKINSSETEFTWTQIGFSNEQGYNHSKDGMPELLKKIKEVAEI